MDPKIEKLLLDKVGTAHDVQLIEQTLDRWIRDSFALAQIVGDGTDLQKGKTCS